MSKAKAILLSVSITFASHGAVAQNPFDDTWALSNSGCEEPQDDFGWLTISSDATHFDFGPGGQFDVTLKIDTLPGKSSIFALMGPQGSGMFQTVIVRQNSANTLFVSPTFPIAEYFAIPTVIDFPFIRCGEHKTLTETPDFARSVPTPYSILRNVALSKGYKPYDSGSFCQESNNQGELCQFFPEIADVVINDAGRISLKAVFVEPSNDSSSSSSFIVYVDPDTDEVIYQEFGDFSE